MVANAAQTKQTLSALDGDWGLNRRQMLFAQLVAQGKSNREAYTQAGYRPTTSDNADASAARLAGHVRVSELIVALRRERWVASCMHNSERRSILGKIARMDAEGKPTHGQIVQAIREDAILAGERQADAVNLQVNLNVGAAVSALGGIGAALPVEDAHATPFQIDDTGLTQANPYPDLGKGANAGIGLSQLQPEDMPISAEQSPLEPSPQPLGNPLAGLASAAFGPDADPVETIDRTFARPWLGQEPPRAEGSTAKPPYGGLSGQPFEQASAPAHTRGTIEDYGDE